MSEKKEITILQINDTHGYLEEHWEHFWDGAYAKYIRAGGFARIKTYVDQVRKQKDDKRQGNLGHERENLDLHAIEALKKYLERHGTVDAELKGSIVAV